MPPTDEIITKMIELKQLKKSKNGKNIEFTLSLIYNCGRITERTRVKLYEL